MTCDSPRLPKTPPEAWTDEMREVFAIYEGEPGRANGSKFNVVHLFANNPPLAHRWLAFSKALVNGVLDRRLQELAILRVADRYSCDYEWDQHVRIARHFGATDAEIEAVKAGPEAEVFGADERLVLSVADQLCETADLDDATWAALQTRFRRDEIIELMFTVGSYSMMSWIFRATRLQPEINLTWT